METAQPREETAQTGWLNQLTIADGIFAFILVGAGLIRLFRLGQIPLSDQEADLALAVWRFWQPDTAAVTIGSPGYFTLTAFLTQVLGTSDAVVRLVPALFGLGLVTLPWLLRARSGTWGALVTSLFLAISPLNVVVARTAGGDSMALFAILLLLVALLRYQETASQRWLNTAFVALGIGLASSAVFYSALVTLIAAWAVQRRLGLPVLGGEAWPQPDREAWRTAVFTGGGVFVALAAMFLWHPAGLGAVARLLGAWVGQFNFQAGRSILDPLLALVRYEPVLATLGVLAIVWTVWRGRALALLCLYWLSAGLLLLLLQGGQMNNALVLTIPGFMLLGLFADAFLAESWHKYTWALGLGLLLVAMVLLVNVARYSRVVTTNPQETRYLVVILLAFILAALAIYVIGAEHGLAVAQGTLLAALVFFVYFHWGTAWWLGHEAANDPRERWVSSGTGEGMRVLAETIADIALQANNSSTRLDLVSSVDTPALRWYLRQFDRLQVSDTLPAERTAAVFITPADTDARLDESYFGADFAIRNTGIAPAQVPSVTPLYDTLTWWLFHKTTAVPQMEWVILWVRSDLTGSR